MFANTLNFSSGSVHGPRMESETNRTFYKRRKKTNNTSGNGRNDWEA